MQENQDKKSKYIDNVRKRIIYFADFKGGGRNVFMTRTGIKKGMFDPKDIDRAVGTDKISNILESYPDLCPKWLLTGKGEMLIEEREFNDNKEVELSSIAEGVPYWDLPVSGGKSVVDIIGKKLPTGYIKGLPNADLAESILPVQGFSMEPEICNGALIGVRKINNWEGLNTERIYLIITQDDRMVKRIREDNEDDNILYCISPNYPEFKIYKSEIIEIQRVCFVYNPK